VITPPLNRLSIPVFLVLVAGLTGFDRGNGQAVAIKFK